MQRVVKTLIVTGAMALVLAPVQARADGFFSPWIGSAFGAGNGVSAANIEAGATTFGITAGGMGAGIIGGEVDFGYSPSFFGDKQVFGTNIDDQPDGQRDRGRAGRRTDRRGHPSLRDRRPRPAAHADRRRKPRELVASDNGLGWNAGAGVMGYFADHIGVRGDLRYIRGFNETDFGIFDRRRTWATLTVLARVHRRRDSLTTSEV